MTWPELLAINVLGGAAGGFIILGIWKLSRAAHIRDWLWFANEQWKKDVIAVRDAYGAIAPRWWNRPCVNCGDPGRCLCVYCLRAIVVPLLIAELLRRLF